MPVEIVINANDRLNICRDGLTFVSVLVGTILPGASTQGPAFTDGRVVLTFVRAAADANILTPMVSFDAGATWAQNVYPKLPGAADAIDALIFPSGVVLALVNSANPVQLYRLLPGGAWSSVQIANVNSAHSLARRQASGEVFVSTSGNINPATANVYFSNDQGATWTGLGDANALTGASWFEVPVAFDIGLKAQTNQVAAFQTILSRFPTPDSTAGKANPVSVAEKQEDLNAIANRHVASTKNGMLFATASSFYRSLDGGVTWTATAHALGAAEGMAPSPTTRGRLFAGFAGGIQSSDDNGTTWAGTTALRNSAATSFAMAGLVAQFPFMGSSQNPGEFLPYGGSSRFSFSGA